MLLNLNTLINQNGILLLSSPPLLFTPPNSPEKLILLEREVKSSSYLLEDIEKVKGHSPSTNDVNNVTLAAFLLPAGRFKPILSSRSLRYLPPFFDLALESEMSVQTVIGDGLNSVELVLHWSDKSICDYTSIIFIC